MDDLLLCSGSPRRRQLLAALGCTFEVVPPEVDESLRPGEAPLDYAARLAAEKAVAGLRARGIPGHGRIALAADTIVIAPGGEVLGKPRDRADAARMLRSLGGREHRVATAVCVAGREIRQLTVQTAVRFAPLDDARVRWLVESGECDDKAGAYAVQGLAGAFIERVDGSLTNVIGLPLAETAGLLRLEGLEVPWT